MAEFKCHRLTTESVPGGHDFVCTILNLLLLTRVVVRWPTLTVPINQRV